MAPIIEIQNLSKYYGERTAVDNISFEIGENALFGFVGPNGAGKTTTIRILTTLLKPSSGQVMVDGQTVAWNPQAVRQKIGYMPDFFGTYNNLTVWEYLDFFSGCYGIGARERLALINDLLALVELSHRRDDFVDTLSRGMKQRLSLARTLVHDPKVLVLDEPASGLDPRARVEFRDLLSELHRMGKTILFSSHILADIAEICTEVAIIEAGKMVIQGNIESMQRQMRLNRTVNITLLGDGVEAAKSTLALHQGVGQIDIKDKGEGEWGLSLQFGGDKLALSNLIKQLALADIPMIGFSEESESLEELFMKLTEGIVS